MRMIVALAAAMAAFAGVSAASARDRSGGHWEWLSRAAPGPRSSVPSPVRVWVTDREPHMADCNCKMMKADTAGCMMTMPDNDRPSSAG